MNNDLKQDFLSLIETLRKEKEYLAQMYQYRLEISLRQETEIEDLKRQIAELEKELSYLRSSCDDSFLNTIERANKLSLKCASLENTIAEFDVYKKDAQEVHDKLTKLYYSEQTIRNNLSSKLWRSRREVAKLKRDLVKATMQIAELGGKYSSAERERSEYESMYNSILAQYAELKVKLNAIEQDKPATDLSGVEWAKWVATDENGAICVYRSSPIKGARMWHSRDLFEDITPDQAKAICGRLPKWSDDEPTPIYE